MGEVKDFTPWLAKEENLKLLGDTIGIDLEFEAKETDVGPFQADILCKDALTSHRVLIENQLEETNHSHLGQILTYGAGLGATTIVWIAKRFTEEHRAALDWLNVMSANAEINFFGLEIELWRIGNSPIAPKFNVVCKPNDWAEDVSKIVKRELTETRRLQLNYWTEFAKFLRESDSMLKIRAPQPAHYMNVSIGNSHAHLDALAYAREKKIAVQLILFGSYFKNKFEQLQQEKEAINNEIGSELFWDNSSAKTIRYIRLVKKDEDIKDSKNWPNQHKWLYEKLEAFYSTFAERLKNLDEGDYEPENSDSANENAEASDK